MPSLIGIAYKLAVGSRARRRASWMARSVIRAARHNPALALEFAAEYSDRKYGEASPRTLALEGLSGTYGMGTSIGAYLRRHNLRHGEGGRFTRAGPLRRKLARTALGR